MHWQIEAWKCAEPKAKPNHQNVLRRAVFASKTSGQCGQVFYRREQFHAHLLSDAHNITDQEYAKEQCKNRRVGRNGQRGFWCGFCQTIIKLDKRGLEAWDERFDHIDRQHFNKGQRVDEWFPMDKDIPKGILTEEQINKLSTDEENYSYIGQEDASYRKVIPGEAFDTIIDTETIRPIAATVPGHEGTPNAMRPGAGATTIVRQWYCVSCFPTLDSYFNSADNMLLGTTKAFLSQRLFR